MYRLTLIDPFQHRESPIQTIQAADSGEAQKRQKGSVSTRRLTSWRSPGHASSQAASDSAEIWGGRMVPNTMKDTGSCG